MGTGDWSEGEEATIGARHLMICREVIWNAHDSDAPYTLRGVIHRLRPRAGYPSVLDRPLHMYVEFFGDVGEYDVWLDLVRLAFDDGGDVVDEEEVTVYGPFTLNLLPDRFVQGRWYVLRTVPFPVPGQYEFRLRVGGMTDPLISERLQLED